MVGITHANRSAVTCELRCGSQCSRPAPNRSAEGTFREVASQALSRRAVLGAALGAGLVLISGSRDQPASASPSGATASGAGSRRHHRGSRLDFEPITGVSATMDTVAVPAGYRWQPLIRWGDPILPGAPEFDSRHQTPESQAGQFGYNNDYTDIITLSERRALLVCNHEYTNEWLMFPPDIDPAVAARIGWEAHGMSVVELTRRRAGQMWSYQRDRRLNRRITLTTPFVADGPAAGSDLLRTEADPTGRHIIGTMNNCSGGTTPWNSVLSGEENIHQCFYAEGTSETELRYGLTQYGDPRKWRDHDPRWDAANPGYVNEPNRFGWIIEIDPFDPSSTPVKHTAMGRFKHEGANVTIAPDGRAVAYMGDDEHYEYIYKFVSRKKYDPRPTRRARRHNFSLLSDGDLYVARFNGNGLGDGLSDGAGEWIPLTKDGESRVPGMSLEEVLVFARLAADKVGGTRMDRPEDVQPSPQTGRVYAACTNNALRVPQLVDEANPREYNKDGHIVEIIESGEDSTATTFSWNLLLICGGPETAGTYFGGYTGPVSPISCPDNLAFDSAGDLWVATDGQPKSLALNDGLFKVSLSGAERGRVQQFLSIPIDAETGGPVIHDKDGSVFVAVQHPGEEGSWDAPRSRFPDYVEGEPEPGTFDGPRPSIIQVVRSS